MRFFNNSCTEACLNLLGTITLIIAATTGLRAEKASLKICEGKTSEEQTEDFMLETISERCEGEKHYHNGAFLEISGIEYWSEYLQFYE